MLFCFRLLFLFFFVFSSLHAHAVKCPPNVPTDAWENLQPYLLPEKHPAKKILDRLFLSGEILKNEASLKKAKFKKVGGGSSKVKVFRHKKLKKYLIKAYTDDQTEIREWEAWTRRILGSLVIRQAIEMHDLQKVFTVPKKWIYQVEREQSNREAKHFVLVVEDMQIFSGNSNYLIWNGSASVSKEKLEILYRFAKEVGLSDSLFIDNIPFTKDMKIAFIDTEYFHRWPIYAARLGEHLSTKMQAYWNKIIAE